MAPTTRSRPTAQTTEELPLQPQAADAALLDEVIERSSSALDQMASRYSTALADPGMGHLRRAMLLGKALSRLEAALTPEIMAEVMRLMNTKVGFKTDRPNKTNPNPYPPEVVKRCLIQALLAGVYPVGNEFNIISGDTYIAQAGYRRLVQELPGLTDLDVRPGVPMVHNGQTVVRVYAVWRINGVKHELLDGEGKPGRVFPVSTNASSNADNTTGKALRKAYKAIYEKSTGSVHTADDGDVDDAAAAPQTPAGAAPAPGASRTDQVAARLQMRNGNGASREQAETGELAGPAVLEHVSELFQQLDLTQEELAASLRPYKVDRLEALTAKQAAELETKLAAQMEDANRRAADDNG